MAVTIIIPDGDLQVGFVDKGRDTFAAVRCTSGGNAFDVYLTRDNLELLIAALDEISDDPGWLDREP